MDSLADSQFMKANNAGRRVGMGSSAVGMTAGEAEKVGAILTDVTPPTMYELNPALLDTAT